MTGAKCRGLDVSVATAVAAPLRRPKVGVGHLPLSIESILSEVRQQPYRSNTADRGPEKRIRGATGRPCLRVRESKVGANDAH